MLNRLKPLTTLPFLICLVLLVLNDFYLKATFHNALTGKLSDFCGLFIFPIFWSVFLPKRKTLIFFLTGLFFIYWKSEYSAPFIEFFNTYCFPIQRVVDPTDLIALAVVPLAWYSLKVRTINLHFNPSFIAVLAFFAFCASSQPRYYQAFDQPQYVLFKSNVIPDSTNYYDDFSVYHFDSLLVVEVKELMTSRRPIKRDDYDKNIVVSQFEESIRNQMPTIESLMTPGKVTTLTIKTPHYEDFLQFKGGRLDGKFVRKNGNRVLIEGFYKNGIEDSTWTISDSTATVLTKKTFVKGETTKIQQFKSAQLISSESVATRADTIIWKYVHLVLLMGLSIFMIVLIVKNYRVTSPESLQIKLIWKCVLCLTLPILVWIAQIGIAIFIPDHFSEPLAVVFNFVFIYMYTLPLFIITVSFIKFRKQIDILWYVLLFALLYNFVLEVIMLIELSTSR